MRIRSLVVASFALVTLTVPAAGRGVAQVCDASLAGSPAPWPDRGGGTSISARADASAWVVGSRHGGTPEEPQSFGFGLRWDGAAWSRHKVAAPRSFVPKAVVDLATRAWAVGARFDPTTDATRGSMIQRWDGAEWRRARGLPSVMLRSNTVVWAIDASGPGDVWAAGLTSNATVGLRMVVLHRTGGDWIRVPAPIPGQDPDYGTRVTDVAAIAPDDAWIVGSHYPDGEVPFTLHWDGERWRLVDVPDIKASLVAVDAGAVNDVWAVGRTGLGAAFVMRHDGDAWSEVPVDTGYASTQLAGVAVGPKGPIISGSGTVAPVTTEPVAMRWDGSGWVSVPIAPVDGTEVTGVGPVDATSGGTAFMLGSIGLSRVVVLRGCGF